MLAASCVHPCMLACTCMVMHASNFLGDEGGPGPSMTLRRLRQCKEAQQLAAQESQNLSGFLCSVYRVIQLVRLELKRSYMIVDYYCWLIWCERKILFWLKIYDRL